MSERTTISNRRSLSMRESRSTEVVDWYKRHMRQELEAYAEKFDYKIIGSMKERWTYTHDRLVIMPDKSQKWVTVSCEEDDEPSLAFLTMEARVKVR